jgi:hypothetical protein
MAKKRSSRQDDVDGKSRPTKQISRPPRGLSIPAGTLSQEVAGLRVFQQFLDKVGVDEATLVEMNAASTALGAAAARNFYSLLTAFTIHLQTLTSKRARDESGLLSKATVFAYYSQAVNYLRERYPGSLPDSKRVARIHDAMGSAIDERNLKANVQTNEAPGCDVKDLHKVVNTLFSDQNGEIKPYHDAAVLVTMWHTFGRAIDTCFARRRQLCIVDSSELFMKVARIKTSVVQGISIYKSSRDWQQCALHSLGVLFICSQEPSEYLFHMIPRSAESDVPGGATLSQEEAILF